MATIKRDYPPLQGRIDWISGEKAAREAVSCQGATWPELIDGVRRMAANIAATGSYALAPKRFFGDPDRPWSQPWTIPDRPRRKTRYELAKEALDRA